MCTHVYIYIYICIYIYIYMCNTYIIIYMSRTPAKHVAQLVGPADCNECNCNRKLCKHMY